MRIITITIVLLLQISSTKAQSIAERFYIGIYGGVNASMVLPLTGHSIVSGNAESADKDYDLFVKNLGKQIGVMARFDFTKAICLSIEPGYTTYSYGYGNRYQWQGLESILYEINYKHRLQFIDIPAFLEFKKPGRFQPYLKGGGYVGTMLGAGSQVEVIQSSAQLGQPQSNSENGNVSSADAFKPLQYGVAAGGGIRYAIGSTLIGLDFTYKFPLSKLSSTSTRFANNQLAGGFYDVADEVMLHNFGLNLQIIVPFIKKGGSAGSGGGGRGRGRMKGPVPCPSEL